MKDRHPCKSLGLPCELTSVDRFLSEPSDSVRQAVSRMSGDFLVLGAGGKMGLHLCLMLRQAFDQTGRAGRVVAVSRFGSVHSRLEFEAAGIETRACDLRERKELEALERLENIIFMAGAKFGTTGQPDLLRRMNVEMPEQVARRFCGSRMTAFSTGCVYSFAPVHSAGSREDGETKPVGEYAQSCLGREEAFRRVALEFQTPLALIRLNYAVEFRYGVLVDIAQKVFQGEPVNVRTGHVNVIWQRDAVARTILAHELAAHPPFIINLTGPEVLQVRDLAVRFGRLLGREPVFEGEEESTAWLNDATLSRQLFGPMETSLDEMIDWIAAWVAGGLATLGKPTGFEKRDGNF